MKTWVGVGGAEFQGVQEKLGFCTIYSNPSLANIAVRDLQSSQRIASVQSFLLAGNFLYNQYQPSAGEGEVANFPRILGKKTQYCKNTLYLGLLNLLLKFIKISQKCI